MTGVRVSGPLPIIMVGGGANALIGPVHRAALARNGAFALAGGLFSSDAERSIAFGESLGLDPAACRGPLAEVVARVRAVHPSVPIAAAICSPNDGHAAVCIELLGQGLHVMCDKPLATTPEEVAAIADAARTSGCVLAVSYNHSGYPMVRQARQLVARGDIGEVRQVSVEYLQGQLHELIEQTEIGRRKWRLASGRAGASLVLMDIGSHALHLATFVTGTPVESVCADVGATMPDRQIHDYASALLRFGNGARGTFCVTQAASGMENDLRLRVVGSRGSLEWRHQDAQHLYLSRQGEPQQRFSAGSPSSGEDALAASFLPTGHPQGFVDAFSVLYREFRQAIDSGERPPALPGLPEGEACARFAQAAIASTDRGTWVRLDS